VAADVHYYDAHQAPGPFLWRSLQQNGPYMPTLHVRIAGADTGAMIAAVRREFDSIDKGFPIFNIRTMADRMDDALSSERMVASIAEAFGALALTLAAVGIYGVLAYSVSRRTREIGVRMALGARRGAVVWLVARKALSLVLAGTVAGAVLAGIGSRVLAQYLRNVSGVDLQVAAVAAGIIAAITAAAVTVPALRGCRIDPLEALRQD
jgi:ABC-type antimicrobial peptide transport system permease subunit